MKFLKGETKIFKVFNIVDVLIIAFVIVIGIVAVLFLQRTVSRGQNASLNACSVKLEVRKADISVCEAIKDNAKVYDRVDNKYLGTVVSSEYEQDSDYNVSADDGKVVQSKMPELYRIYIDINLDSGEDVYIGKTMSIKTKDFTAAGVVINKDKPQQEVK